MEVLLITLVTVVIVLIILIFWLLSQILGLIGRVVSWPNDNLIVDRNQRQSATVGCGGILFLSIAVLVGAILLRWFTYR